MNIIMNASKKYSNIVITMTPQEVRKNLVIYNGERLTNEFDIATNAINFQIKLQSKGEF